MDRLVPALATPRNAHAGNASRRGARPHTTSPYELGSLPPAVRAVRHSTRAVCP